MPELNKGGFEVKNAGYWKRQADHYREKFETVQPLIDCRVCDYYVAGYMPCTSTRQCIGGDMWTRTKTIQVWPNACSPTSDHINGK
jgi:hypothetical protein